MVMRYDVIRRDHQPHDWGLELSTGRRRTARQAGITGREITGERVASQSEGGG
jgi:hypothetical protein